MISFVWQGVTERKDHWRDGLWAAMQLLEKEHEVEYKEPWEELNGDVILYWEAPVTIVGENSEHYKKVMSAPQKKALLFAGGMIKPEWVEGFDLLFVESAINEDECYMFGIPYKRAFGVNTDIFKPMNLEKKWEAIHQGTCASWKRQWLVGEAYGDKALLVGRYQESDPRPFDEARKHGTEIMDEKPYEEVAKLINQSKYLAQTADFWGGGQRATLEAMACGVHPIVMTDSPKNREFVEESGFGCVVEPRAEAIREAEPDQDPQIGIDYVNSKWTPRHYADSLLEGINEICNTKN